MPNANLVAAQNQLRNLVSIYNRNFDQYQQATYQSLYYPNNSYEFGVVDPYIIGQIYELYSSVYG